MFVDEWLLGSEAWGIGLTIAKDFYHICMYIYMDNTTHGTQKVDLFLPHHTIHPL